MTLDWWTFGLQTVNFAILVWLLQRFLYKPVLRMVDARRAEMEKVRASAQEDREKARAERERVATEHAQIEAERRKTIADARAEAEALATEKIDQADKEATEIREKARTSLAAERKAAETDIRRAALDLGTDIARRLIEELPVESRTEAWIGHIEQHLAELTEAQRSALLQGMDGTSALRVVAAAPFPESVAQHWRERLQTALGHELRIDFAHDPDLVAGVELHFPTAVLHFSWRSTLEAIRAEIEDDAETR
ncbi:F0F1 ATP synthase subunit B family protein [Nisaea sediminum]|uniref:F0F1 ATP synthase subunit B family protein n=1 Tax=Nisaea sediminum TaxID=2775867 RepID=UPI0018662EF4|nr:hypothetical protein [Nisaea sediminum]